ncbi:MAG: CRISPR-associated protein Csx18 [Gloeobacterales cyanobacterium]
MRLLLLRHVSSAAVNGAITLVILLIAPLGLASVLTCTALITLSTLVVGMTADGVERWLMSGSTGLNKVR